MRYKAVFTDELLSYFRLDDNKTLVLTDRHGFTRAVPLEVEIEPKHGKQMYNAFKFCPNCGAQMERSEKCQYVMERSEKWPHVLERSEE